MIGLLSAVPPGADGVALLVAALRLLDVSFQGARVSLLGAGGAA